MANNTTRIPYLAGPDDHPLQCPLCPQHPPFPAERSRNIHYFKHRLPQPEIKHPQPENKHPPQPQRPERIPYLAGLNSHPLQCPLCPPHPPFTERSRNIHHFQHRLPHPENKYPPRPQIDQRIPSLPGPPLRCPACPQQRRFNNEEGRDLHYFQTHILNLPETWDIGDRGNRDGPLGIGKHVFEVERYCREPETYGEWG